MNVSIRVQAILPTYADPNLTIADANLYNDERERVTQKMIERAIKQVLIKRGAWEPRIKIGFERGAK